MDDENVFLRGILTKPDDAALRLNYADWLEKRGDPRAQFLRMEPNLEHVSYATWLEKTGRHPASYIQDFPEVKREIEERQATEHLREERRSLGAKLDPDWVAFINTFGCRFVPYYLFDNTGPSRCMPDDLPFTEQIGMRGRIVTFESDFQDEQSWEQGLLCDAGFLSRMELDECAYGAATCPVHPFICELKTKRRPLTGADVLMALRPRNFHSEYIQTLEATSIPYPGYHPGDGDGFHNDEIHNDFAEQCIFEHEDDDSTQEVDEFSGTHGMLKRFVVDGKLWYVLLHTTPEDIGDFWFSRYALLLAVGLSPHGERLLGVVTHQICHNLCD